MKTLFLSLLILLGFGLSAQNTTTGYVQPLGTTFGNQTVIRMLYAPTPAYGYGQALVYLPDDYNLPKNANKYYPCLFFSPGSGETDDANIYEVTLTSLPQLIAQGFKPYSIDTLTGDTVKWIVISQHPTVDANNAGGAAYAYPQLQYTIPYLMADSIYRIDTTCFWFAGLSNGARATVSLYVGNNIGDTAIGKRITGIFVISGAGYDNFQNSTHFANLDTIMQRGGKAFATLGSADQNNNAVGYQQFDTAYAHWAKPPGFRGAYRHYIFAGAGHSNAVWNPCFQLNFKNLDSTQYKWNPWDLMWAMRKGATVQSSTTCYAGANQAIQLPTSTATLSGIGTPKAGTSITTYLWTRVSGPNVPAITSTSSPTTSVTGLIAGTYIFNLHVVASDASNADATVQVIVSAASNIPPVSSAGSDQVIVLPTSSITLAGSATDADGTISTHTWTKVSGPAGSTITTPSSYTSTVTGLVAGVYVFRLSVTDNNSGTSTDDMQVTVNPSGTLPGLTVKKVGLTEYKVGYLMSDSSIRSPTYNNSTGKVELMSMVVNSQKIVDVSAGFNQLIMADATGYAWTTNRGVAGITANQCTRIDVDTFGNPANFIGTVSGYFYTFLGVKLDSTQIYEVGGNSYNWHNPTLFNPSNLITKWYPIHMMPGGKKIAKISMGQNVVALTSDGQVWELVNGDSVWHQKTLPRPAIDICTSHYPWSFAIIPDATGSQTMGYPYVWGSQSDFWGNGSPVSYTQPTSLKTLWGMTVPIRICNMNQNVFHFIDSLNRHFAIGDNPNGEMGIGEELVNQYFYKTRYAWSWTKSEHIQPLTQVMDGIDWSGNARIYANNSYAFFFYFSDKNDSLYNTGRDKSFVGGKGKVNNNEVSSPNALDVIKVTMVHPILNFPGVGFNFAQPTITINPNANINSSSMKLTASAVAAQAAGLYNIVAYRWSLESGAAVTFDRQDSSVVNVSGLTTGTYVFRAVATDNNTGTVSAVDTFVVAGTVFTPPTVSTNGDQIITLPTSSVSLIGTSTPHSATIASSGWSKVSGNGGTVTSLNSASTTATGLTAGKYVFRFAATDSNGQISTSDVTITVNPSTSNCNCLAPSTPTKL